MKTVSQVKEDIATTRERLKDVRAKIRLSESKSDELRKIAVDAEIKSAGQGKGAIGIRAKREQAVIAKAELEFAQDAESALLVRLQELAEELAQAEQTEKVDRARLTLETYNATAHEVRAMLDEFEAQAAALANRLAPLAERMAQNSPEKALSRIEQTAPLSKALDAVRRVPSLLLKLDGLNEAVRLVDGAIFSQRMWLNMRPRPAPVQVVPMPTLAPDPVDDDAPPPMPRDPFLRQRFLEACLKDNRAIRLPNGNIVLLRPSEIARRKQENDRKDIAYVLAFKG